MLGLVRVSDGNERASNVMDVQKKERQERNTAQKVSFYEKCCLPRLMDADVVLQKRAAQKRRVYLHAKMRMLTEKKPSKTEQLERRTQREGSNDEEDYHQTQSGKGNLDDCMRSSIAAPELRAERRLAEAFIRGHHHVGCRVSTE